MHRLLSFVLAAVAVHSLVLGSLMLWQPLLVLDALGWDFAGAHFFPAQSGLFLLILGVFYAAAMRHRPYVWVVIVSKAFALVFLVTEVARGSAPSIVYLAALLDGLMGATVGALWSLERRSLAQREP